MKKYGVCLLFFCVTGIFLSCQQKSRDKQAEVMSIMKQYERYVLEMQMDSLVSLFSADGETGQEGTKLIQGKDSIRSFLASFTNVKVLEHSNPIDYVAFEKDTGIVTGRYSQTALINEHDTVHVKGKFTAKLLPAGKSWLIRRMTTRSL